MIAGTARPGALLAALGPLVLAAAQACSSERPRREVERSVREYDDALILAYRTSDVAGLRDVAGEGEVRRIAALIDLKRSSRLVLESSIESFVVTDVTQPSPDGAIVRTKERWRYQDRSTQPGQPPGTLFVAAMEMEYEVRREGKRWKVMKGRTLRNDYLEPRGFALGPSAGHGRGGEPETRGH